MSRHKTSAPAVALMPFLAVLLCTMGALIVVLVSLSSRMRQQALARAAEPPPRGAAPAAESPPTWNAPPVPAPARPAPQAESVLSAALRGRTLVEEVRKTRDQLRAERLRREEQARAHRERARQAREERVRSLQEQTQAVERARTALQELDREIESLETELAERRNRLKQAQEQAAESRRRSRQNSERLAALRREQRELAEDLQFAQSELDRLERDHAEAESRFSIVPYDGASGTSRRPIFIECTEKGLRFLPEDVLIEPKALSGQIGRVNPLLLGVQSLMLYWSGQLDLRPDRPDPVLPYPLLLVRPDGSVAYMLARELLRDLGHPFGYELIDNDFPLDLEPADPQAKAILLKALRDARPGLLAEPTLRLPGEIAASSPEALLSGRPILRSDAARGRPGGSPAAAVARAPEPAVPRASSATAAPEVAPRSAPAKSAGRGRTGSTLSATDSLRPGERNAAYPAGPADSSEQAAPRPPSLPDAGRPRRERPGPTGAARNPGDDSADAAEQGEPGARTGSDPAPESLAPASLRSRTHAASPPSDHAEGEPARSQSFDGKPQTGSKLLPQWGTLRNPKTIGLEKVVPIQVESRRVVVGGLTIPAGDEQTLEEFQNEVHQALNEIARAWGQAPQGFHWKPSLRCTVHEGGNVNYQRLGMVLRRAGLSTRAEFVRSPRTPPAETASPPPSLRSRTSPRR